MGDVAVRRSGRWREWEELHAIGGRMPQVLGRVAPGAPRRAVEEPARPLSRTARVSVIIPCYNYARFLPDAVSSALDQAGVDVEVIIVDDRSTDDSRDVGARLAETHAAVRMLVNAENCGHVRSFNAGWAVSTGEYVVKLDADDLLAPNALTRAAAVFEAHPAVGLVYGHPRHFWGTEVPAARVSTVRWSVWRGQNWLAERCRLGVSAITNPEMVLRSSLLREWGPMDPAVEYAPDMEISLRLAAVSDIARIDGADQALHREHEHSMSETEGSGTLVDLRAREAAFAHALDRVRDRVHGARRLESQARRALAKDSLRFAAAALDRGRPQADLADLLQFGAEVWPECTTWRSFRRMHGDRDPWRVAALARRAARRLRHEVYYARWLVSGV
jgi:glycosyltransferase involved in cell wall biosynthesis